MLQFAKKNQGFSLLELLVTLAIAAIVLGIGLPSFKQVMADSQMTAVSNALVYSVHTARSESVERMQPVGICTSTNPMELAAGCDNGVGYDSGWIVYVDEDGNGSRNGNETVVHRVEAPGAAFSFTPDNVYANQIYFNASGSSVNVANVPLSGTIVIDFMGGAEKRDISVSANGRVSTKAHDNP